MCGEEAYSRFASRCDEHRALKKDAPPKSTASSRATGPRAGAPVVKDLQAEIERNLLRIADAFEGNGLGPGEGSPYESFPAALRGEAKDVARFWAHEAERSNALASKVRFLAAPTGILGGLIVHGRILRVLADEHLVPRLQRWLVARRLAAIGVTPDVLAQFNTDLEEVRRMDDAQVEQLLSTILGTAPRPGDGPPPDVGAPGAVAFGT